MILYCDTSALAKLYLVETQSDSVANAAAAAEIIAVSRLTWVELASALSRRAREQPADAAVIDQSKRRLADDWPHYLVVDFTQPLAEQAGEFADAFALRAYDAVQLASAHLLHSQSGQSVRFACFDARLNKAAKVLGLDVALPNAGQDAG